RRHVGAADAVMEAEFEAVPDLVSREQLVQRLRLGIGHVRDLADKVANPLKHLQIFLRSRRREWFAATSWRRSDHRFLTIIAACGPAQGSAPAAIRTWSARAP